MTRRTRSRRSPHRPSCRHCPRVRLLGHDFQLWRAAWCERLERESAGYTTEAQQFTQADPPPTFRRYLEAMAGSGWPMSGSAP